MGIKFFRKNRMDLDFSSVEITVTDGVATNNGQDFVNFLRNRNNTSGWMTTDSDDSANTEMIVDFSDSVTIDTIILIGHNFKAYTIKWWDGALWQDFSTPIAETVYTAEESYHPFDSQMTNKLQLIIDSTQVVDDDKSLVQFIATDLLGEFEVEPIVVGEFDRDRKVTKALSGKNFIAKAIGGFNCQIKMNNVVNDNDLTLVETLYESFEGFLVWLSGGDSTQFQTQRKGFLLEDLYLMNCVNEYKAAWEGGFYKHGMAISLNLVEVN